MYVVNSSDGRCLVAVRLIVGVRYLERPLREVLLHVPVYIYIAGPRYSEEMVNRCVAAWYSNNPNDRVTVGSVAVAPG